MHVNCLDSVVQLNNKTIKQLNNKKLLSQAFLLLLSQTTVILGNFTFTLHLAD